MRFALQHALAIILTGVLLSTAPVATAQNSHANSNAFDDGSNGNPPGQDKKNTAPEIHPVAAGAVGILVVGGIALLTARRRAHAA